MAARGLILRDNLGKTARWRLNPSATGSAPTSSAGLAGRKLEIVSMLMAGPLSTGQLADRMGISVGAVRRHLQDLGAAGAIAPTANKQSPHNTWVLVSPDELREG